MRLTDRALKMYRAEARRTGSYVIARQTVMRHYKLTARRFDQMLRMLGRER